MSVSILKAGVLDTIQDLGRHGFSDQGINVNGPMDAYAMKVANALVSNNMNAPVLEMHFPGPQILFEQNALISITGGNFSPTLNGEPVNTWKPIVVKRKSVLQFTYRDWGARMYLAIHGGFSVCPWLGSSSTNLKAKAGGWGGRKLEKGDELPFAETDLYFPALLGEDNVAELPWSIDRQNIYRCPHEIFFLPGKEWCILCDESKEHMLQDDFIIHPSFDRMGLHLRGSELHYDQQFQLVSSAVNFGTMQLLPSKQLVILMADHQTTGGYPRIGHIISAHLPKLAQLATGDPLKLNPVDMETAEALMLLQEREIQMIATACRERMKNAICVA